MLLLVDLFNPVKHCKHRTLAVYRLPWLQQQQQKKEFVMKNDARLQTKHVSANETQKIFKK